MLINIRRSLKYIRYCNAIWLYLFLLIFEGAIRKWLLPSIATPLLIVREPIVVWLVIIGIQKGWLKNGYVIIMMVVSTISLLATIFVGHEDLFTALYGWRIYFFYFPFIFVIGHVITREDLLKMGRYLLYLSIPMTILIIIQFYSPQSAWVNRGVGGDLEGAGFSGALGYFRPSGTFSFISGFICFQLIVACYLFYYMLENKSLKKKYKIKTWLLWVMLGCYLVTIPYSISRTHFFQSIVVALFVFFGALISNKMKTVFKIVVLTTIFILGVISYKTVDTGIDVFFERFNLASESEGGLQGTLGNRYLGSIARGLDNDFPFWGYGIGFGTNVGSKFLGLDNMYTKFNSDQEWVRVFGESGFLIGIIIMAVRIFFSISVFAKSFERLKYYHDMLPWLFSSGIFMLLMMGQLNSPSNLGFAIFISGLGVSALKSSKIVIFK